MKKQQLYEMKLHELRFLIKKLEIHKEIHLEAAEKFSKYFEDYINSLTVRSVKHKLKQIAGLAGPNEKPINKTAQNAKQQRQYKQGKTKVKQEYEEVSMPPETPVKPVPKEYKGLYRKIARETHPDVNGGDEKKKKIFQEINNAIEKEDYFKLIEAAMLLNLKIPDDVPLQTDVVENKITLANKEIKQITKSVAWEWYHIEEEESKKVLIEKYANFLLENQ